MECNQRRFAQDLQELFRMGLLLTLKMPMKSLGLLIDGLKKYKSECTEAIATFLAILYRKREVAFNQNHSLFLQGIYYHMVNNGKDKTEVCRIKALFQKLRRAKSYSLNECKIYGYKYQEQPGPQLIKCMQKNVRCAEKIMKEDFKQYTSLIKQLLKKSRLKVPKIPIKILSLLIQRFREDSDPLMGILQVKLTYKKEVLQILSEEELQRNKVFLEDMYQSQVEQNQNKENAKDWQRQIYKLDEMIYEDFRDGLYITGEVLKRFKTKKVLGASKLVFTSPTTGLFSVRVFVTRGARFLEENELIEFVKDQVSQKYREFLTSIDLEKSEQFLVPGNIAKYDVKVEFRCREGHFEEYKRIKELLEGDEDGKERKDDEGQYLEYENQEQQLESEEDIAQMPEVPNK